MSITLVLNLKRGCAASSTTIGLRTTTVLVVARIYGHVTLSYPVVPNLVGHDIITTKGTASAIQARSKSRPVTPLKTISQLANALKKRQPTGQLLLRSPLLVICPAPIRAIRNHCAIAVCGEVVQKNRKYVSR